MLSNYNDAWFMNESIAFYMSTNTFRNPIFDIHSEQDENEIENLSPIGGESTTTSQVQHQQSDSSIKVDGQHGCRDKRRRFSKLRVAEYSIATRQKLNDFRDNLAFSIKGKIFVLELNFKRCLRRLKKFLDKNLPRISSDKQTGFSNYNTGPNNYDADHFGSCSKLDKYIAINQEKMFWQKVQPNSAKSLGVHQERLLSRLERAKRDSHRLFNMDNNNFATYFENDHQDTYRTNGSYHYQAASHHMRPNRPASKQSSQARVGAMGGRFAPDVLADLSSSWSLGPSDELAPKSHSVPASLPDEQAKNGCFLVSGVGGSIKGAKARAGVARKPARPTTTTATKIISSRVSPRLCATRLFVLECCAFDQNETLQV